MKQIISLSVFLFCSVALFAQHRYDESFKKMKRELNLTIKQQKQIKKFDTQADIKIRALKRSNPDAKELEIKTNQFEADRRKKIMAVLNADQQARWQMILDNVPRRGVTGRPNE